MKNLISVLCLSAVVLLPATTQGLTVYSPPVSFGNRLLMECSIQNVGNIVLQVSAFGIADNGQKVPAEPVWNDFAPGAVRITGDLSQYRSCGFWVRAKNPRRTATRDMVRAALQVIDDSHRRVAMEIR